MNALIRGFSGLAVCCLSSLAAAQQPDNVVVTAAPSAATEAPAAPRSVTLAPQQREYPPAPERRWYGWQALGVDGGAVILGLAALGTEGSARSENIAPALLLGGAVAYGAGAPLVHLIHHRPWAALGSLGLRGGLPVVGGAIGLGAATCPKPGEEYGNCGLGELILGAAAGAVVAIALDASLLGWEQPPADAPEQARLGLAPVVASDGRRELRVFGTF